MADSNLVQLIKKIAMDAVDASKQCDYRVGIVTSTDPLKIKLSNSLTLEEDFLHLTQNVTDYITDVSITTDYSWETQEQETHKHGIVIEKKEITIHNALQEGEQVLMMRKAGGQEYVVIDRMVS